MPTNKERAECARKTLIEYERIKDEYVTDMTDRDVIDESVGGLLVDIKHLCNHEGVPFNDVLAFSDGIYEDDLEIAERGDKEEDGLFDNPPYRDGHPRTECKMDGPDMGFMIPPSLFDRALHSALVQDEMKKDAVVAAVLYNLYNMQGMGIVHLLPRVFPNHTDRELGHLAAKLHDCCNGDDVTSDGFIKLYNRLDSENSAIVYRWLAINRF